MPHQTLNTSIQATDIAPPSGALMTDLPRPLDCETLITMGFFLGPILSDSANWDDLVWKLAEKAFTLHQRGDLLVLVNDRNQAVCTTSALGHPLDALSKRLGMPAPKSPDGRIF